jgi:hypothetical protein
VAVVVAFVRGHRACGPTLDLLSSDLELYTSLLYYANDNGGFTRCFMY